jgi:hypothetical protein
MLVLLMEGSYGVRLWDGLRWHYIRTKFNKDWLSYSKVNRGDTLTDINTHTDSRVTS